MGAYGADVVDRMVDGNDATRYLASRDFLAGDWVRIDLGTVQTVESVRLLQGTSEVLSGRFEHSVNGDDWTGGMGPARKVVEATWSGSVEARYVRFLADPGGIGWLAVHEFSATVADPEPDPDPDPDPDPEPPVPPAAGGTVTLASDQFAVLLLGTCITALCLPALLITTYGNRG